ncbi:MAG: tetratricopeptide repeat protein [Candidatus Obscuribacterales bacterium]|nr:tetratricopeptide repeat protein [Candidatus Obscuribacterales bacterium]
MAAKVMQTITELVLQGRWEDAHSLLSQYSDQQPNDPLLQYQIGVLCFNMGDFEQAITHFKASLSLYPDNPDVHYQLGLVLLKVNKPNEAMPQFQEACERKPDFALGHLHWGIALAGTGNIQGALAQFNQASKLSPGLAVSQYQSGLMNLALGKFTEALQHFQRATQLDSKWAAPFIGMGQTHMTMGNTNEAISCFASASGIEPDDYGIRKSWAATLLAAGRYDEAIRIYQDIINLGGRVAARERAMAYNDWGVALFRQGRLEEAADKLVQAADVEPSVWDSRLNLGLINMVLHEHDLASDVFARAAEEMPQNGTVHMYRAIAQLFKGEYGEALNGLSDLQQAKFDHPDVDLWTGYACLAAGRMEDAKPFLERALQADPRNYLALDALGCCFAAAGDHESALKNYGACLTIKRDYGLGHLHAARSLEILGDEAAAKSEYASAVSYDRDVLIPEKEVIDHLLQTSQFDAVIDRSTKLLTYTPDDVEARIALVKAYKEGNQHDLALQMLDAILQQDANYGPAYVLAGQIFLSQGRFVEADDVFRRATEVYEGDAPLYYSWGKTLGLLGLHELAIEKYEQATKIDPYDGDSYEAWGATLKYLGKFSEAAEVYKRAADYI